MNSNMQGHNHGGKNHLLGMLGIAALVLVVLLGSGRSFQQALLLAIVLACPLMMVGMMFMMRGGNGHQNANDAAEHHDHNNTDHNNTDHNNTTDRGNLDAPPAWQDSPNYTPPQSPKSDTRP